MACAAYPMSACRPGLGMIDPSTFDEEFNAAVSTPAPSVTEVADILLRTKFSFVTGGKALNGSPIITFPDNSQVSTSASAIQPEISEYEYRKVVTFLCGVLRPLEEESNPGFVIVIDRRQDRWSSVKSALFKISCFFPGAIHAAYVVRPAGFFQKAICEVSFKMIKDECKFKVIMCNSVEELHNYVERQQLSSDLNGPIEYNHRQWIEQRTAVENFGTKVNEVRIRAKNFASKLPEVELPNEVTTTEELLRTQQAAYRDLKTEMGRSVRQGEQLMTSITGLTLSRESLKLNPDKRLHVDELEKMLTTLESSQRKLEEAWKEHEDKLLQCLQLRRFEQEFKELRSAMQRHLERLRRLTDVGDSVSRVEALLREIRQSEKEAKEDLTKAEQLIQGGEHLIDKRHYAVDSIKPKCKELQLLCDEYSAMWQRQNARLKKSHQLHEKLETANDWCARGVEFLASQQIERFQTVEGAEVAMKDVDDFCSTRPADDVIPADAELGAIFDGDVPESTRVCVQAARQRLADVVNMCDKRRLSLKKINKKHSLLSSSSSPSSTSTTSSSAGGRGGRGGGDGAAEPHTAANGGGGPPVGTVAPIPRSEIRMESGVVGSPTPGTRDRRPGTLTNLTPIHSAGAVNPASRTGAAPGGSPTKHGEHDKQKQGHVMRELIETERTYVTELKAILEGYSTEMDNAELKDLIPPCLVGKKAVLFGNLDAICAFHANVFLKHLESYQETPQLVGSCFVDKSDEFEIYTQYCKNKPDSEVLRREAGENNEFFKECQKRLGHKLPLGAYLLKPVQRITKYQLLLKEMLKYMSPDDEGYKEMEKAKENMLKVIKHVNDVMHQIAITGYKGDISLLGNLLMQGPFNVWTEHKGSGLKDLRFKPMQRHLFLFEKGMILCKKVEQAPGAASTSASSASSSNAATPGKQRPAPPKSGATADKISYQWKNSLNMSTVGLTENVQSDKRKFELWQNQRAEVYILQATTADTKDQWVKEIKDVLLRQFNEIKASHPSLSRLPKVRDLAVVPSSTCTSPSSLAINPAASATATLTSTLPSSPTKRIADAEESPIVPIGAGQSFASVGVIRREPASAGGVCGGGVIAPSTTLHSSPFSPSSQSATTSSTTSTPTTSSAVTHRQKKLKPKTSWPSNSGSGGSRRYSGNASVGSVGSGGSRPTSADYNEYLMMHGGSTTSSTWSSGDEYDEEDEDKPEGEEFDECFNVVGHRYQSLADYHAVDVGELSVGEGQVVEVVKEPTTPSPFKVGSEGWWFVRLVSTGDEGWAPASYLERCPSRAASLSSNGAPIHRRGGVRLSSPSRRNSARSTISMNSLDSSTSVDSSSVMVTPVGSVTPTVATPATSFGSSSQTPKNKRDSGYSTIHSGPSGASSQA